MFRLPSVSNKTRFHFGWLVVAAVAGFWLVMFAAQLKAGVHHPHTQSRQSNGARSCDSPKCAQVGDTATYTLHGRVVSVSEPQPGVICVQTLSATQGGQVCVSK